MNKKKTFYITTPIYYPSGDLHIGHFYTTSISQILINYKKMKGYETLFLTGADEHGQKIEQKATEIGLKPQEYVDKMSLKYIDFWKKIGINYDIYMRTTYLYHVETVQKIFFELLEKGVIYKSFYEGLYSIQDEEFFTKTQAKLIDKEYYSPVSGHKLEWVKEETYFFKMSEYSSFLLDYFKENPSFVQPKKIVNELKNNFLLKGLEDLSVTRTTFNWGIPIVEDYKHVIYVWMDALTNYITALGYRQKNDELYKKFWIEGTERVHVVGKEITRFHCIYWPIILKSLNQPLPTKIFSHGWIVTKTGKMSKSKGNTIDPLEQTQKYTSEVVQYYLVSQIPIGEDGIYDEEALKVVFNADLANNYGNLLSRTIAMSLKNFEKTPKYVGIVNPQDQAIENNISESFKEYEKCMDNFDIFNAVKHAMKLAQCLNKYIDDTTPWKLLADNSTNKLESIISHLLNGIYAVSAMLKPILPEKISQAALQLGVNDFEFDNILNFQKFDNLTIKKGEVLFQRIK